MKALFNIKKINLLSKNAPTITKLQKLIKVALYEKL